MLPYFSPWKGLNGLVLWVREFRQSRGAFAVTGVGSDKGTMGEAKQAVLLR